MTLQVASDQLVGFLLALVRTSAWLVVCPPFNTQAFPVRVKVGLAAALAVMLAPTLGSQPRLLEDTWAFAAALAYQAFTGLALGFAVYAVFAVVQAAGELLDLQAGFAAAAIYDPFTNAATTPIGRLHQLVVIAILFAINGHLVLVRGFITSFQAAPLAGPRLDDLGRLLTEDVARFLLAALQIAAPILAALFLADLVLGLLSRAAPQLNILVFGFALKIGLALVLVAVVLPVMPDTVTGLLERAVRSFGVLLGG